MKKIYYLATGLIFASVSYGQYAESMLVAKNKSIANPQHHTSVSDRAAGDPIGAVMDFSNPADWVMANTGTPSANWVIGTAAPTGGFSAGMGTINSTSGGNFAMFDSDGLGSLTSSQNATIVTANPINLSTYSNVEVNFESYYRAFQGECYLMVSNNGSTFTEYPIHTLVPLNESTENPEVVAINVTSVAANQATVWIGFRYIGGWDYAWMIDDVQLSEGYDDNLILNESYMSSGNEALDYYMVPMSQVAAVTFGGFVTNNGVNNQTNTALNVIVNDGSSNVYNQSSTPVTVPAFSSDSLEIITPAWTPSAAGTYTVSYAVASSATDQTPLDNAAVLEDITVGGNVYGRDNGVVSGAVSHLGSTPVTTVVGNIFEFNADFDLGKVQVMVDGSSDVGAAIYADVRIWNGASFDPVAISDDHSLVNSDLDNMVTLTLQNTVACHAGDVYFIGAGHYGETVWFNTAQVAAGALIFDDGVTASSQNSVFLIRGEEVFAGVEEAASVSELSIYPNPANDFSTVSYTLSNSANVSLVITDISGKVISTNSFGQQNAGNYTSKVALDELSNGVYFFTLIVDGERTTQKVTVSKN